MFFYKLLPLRLRCWLLRRRYKKLAHAIELWMVEDGRAVDLTDARLQLRGGIEMSEDLLE